MPQTSKRTGNRCADDPAKGRVLVMVRLEETESRCGDCSGDGGITKGGIGRQGLTKVEKVAIDE